MTSNMEGVINQAWILDCFTNNSVRLMNDSTDSWPTSPIKSERMTFTPYKSNLTRWRVHPNGVPSHEKNDALFTRRCFAITGIKNPRAINPQTHILPHSRQSLSNPSLVFFRLTLIIPYSAPMCGPHTIGVSPPSSSLFPLVAWRSRNALVTVNSAWDRNLIGHWNNLQKSYSLRMPFLAIAPTSHPPTTLIASWLITSLPSLPRCLKLSTVIVTSSCLPSSKDTCPGEA